MIEGKWICHGRGAAKIAASSLAFYQSCVARINDPRAVKYQPWMSSHHLAKYVFSTYADTDGFGTSFLLSDSLPYHTRMNELLLEVARKDPALEEIAVLAQVNEAKFQAQFKMFQAAIGLVELWSPWMQTVFGLVIKTIIPVGVASGKDYGFSFTDDNFIGAIFASIDPKSPFPELLLNTYLAHELGHQALMIYQHAGDLFYATDEQVYSGVRKTLRPAVASFHAAVALAYLIDCVRSLLKYRSDLAERAYLLALLDDYVDSLKKGLAALQPLRKSPLCEAIYQDLFTHIDG